MKKINCPATLILVIACFCLGGGGGGCTIVTIEVFSQVFARVEKMPENEFSSYHRWEEIDHVRYSREEVYFTSGENRLQGFIYGSSNTNGLVVISEGLGGTADDYFPMIMYFVDKGWRVFAFNNTGVSGSGGVGTRGMAQSLVDLDAALAYVEKTDSFNGLPVMLAGHSWGGYAVCAVLNYDHRVNAVVSFAGYNNGRDVIDDFGERNVDGIVYVLSPHIWAIEKQLFEGAAKFTAIDGINKSGIPVMIVQSVDDKVIPANTTSIYAHRGEISNSRVEVVFRNGESAAGHEYTFCSNAQKEYMNFAVKSWEAYKAKNANASMLQWAEEINFDKDLANELDPELMERINNFFMKNSVSN
jgi:pimeloyl-ACP methyl ester carboxylesterase